MHTCGSDRYGVFVMFPGVSLGGVILGSVVSVARLSVYINQFQVMHCYLMVGIKINKGYFTFLLLFLPFGMLQLGLFFTVN
ncbi:hypothetical protein F4775DRAFT_557595 [Biscogniauxia sp. FL1348]|nr:hypothetical protein F4775DRAFT_557595 [Biscogniauxia sp. FL1348]